MPAFDDTANSIGSLVGIAVIVLVSGFVSILLFICMVDWLTGNLLYGIIAGLFGGAFVMIGMTHELLKKTQKIK